MHPLVSPLALAAQLVLSIVAVPLGHHPFQGHNWSLIHGPLVVE
jgi:hypothetical protein